MRYVRFASLLLTRARKAAAMRLGVVRFTGVGCSSVGSAGLAGTPASSSGRSPAIEKSLHVRVRRQARAFLMMRPRRTGSVAQGSSVYAYVGCVCR